MTLEIALPESFATNAFNVLLQSRPPIDILLDDPSEPAPLPEVPDDPEAVFDPSLDVDPACAFESEELLPQPDKATMEVTATTAIRLAHPPRVLVTSNINPPRSMAALGG